MFDQVDFMGALSIPQIDHHDIKGCIDLAIHRLAMHPLCSPTAVDILDINFFFGLRISHNQTNTWRWCDGSPVLIGKQR